MAKLPRLIGMIATLSFAVSAIVPQPAHAGDDTDLARELWEQGRVLSDESVALSSKMVDAADKGDWTTACHYVRESQRNSQSLFDLTLRMSNLDLGPQNAATVQEQLGNARDALDTVNELMKVPECAEPVEPVDENEKDSDFLNVAVAIARSMDTDGSASFSDGRWSVACSYLTAAQSSYANNSRFALELSERFSAEDNPQPHLVALSTELAGLEKAVTPKRDVACENEKAGG
jgi:hypothetical protein